MILDQLIQALHLRNWYALAALALTLIVQLIKTAPRLQPLWLKIPDGWRWIIPVASGAVTGFTQAFAAGLPLAVALLAALGGALGISIPAMGINALLTESPVKWNGGPGGAPPPPAPRPRPMYGRFPDEPPPPEFGAAAALLLVFGLALQSSGCRPGKPPCDQAKLAGVTAVCTARVRLECVDKGVPEDKCTVLDDCDAQIDEACAK